MPFRLGCCLVQFNFAEYDLERAFKVIHRIGYLGVETYVSPQVLRKGRTELARLLKKYELEPAKFVLGGYGIKSGVGDLAENDATKARTTIRNYKKNVLLGRENGFDVIVMFTGPKPEGMTVAEAIRVAGENLSPVADFARDHGVRLTIETHKGALAHEDKSFLRLRKAAASDNVYANVDPSNYFADGHDVIKATLALRDLVQGVHVKDAIEVDGKVYWAPAGEGVVDWAAFLAALRKIGYDKRSGWVNIEYEAGISGKFYKDPVRGSQDGYDYIKGLIDAGGRSKA